MGRHHSAPASGRHWPGAGRRVVGFVSADRRHHGGGHHKIVGGGVVDFVLGVLAWIVDTHRPEV